MKEVRVTISGTSPLLMNRRPPQDPNEVKVKKNEKTIDSSADAINKSHWDEKLGFYIPSDMIEAAFREAGKGFKIGRGTAKKAVAYSIFVQEEKVPLNKKKPDSIDTRWGTHPSTGNSVAVNRVRFDSWDASFTLQVDEERLDLKTVEAMLSEAGKIVAIGSYRPKFGRFAVKSFEVVK